ncbi:lectin like domain-containing protein [Lacrimispora sp. NSJ-141]|uniref:Lectin like domain-containing protein n=1 Tax=Lientehia hominis TaxID=2897778 RepID=A0AAP2RJG1_9FIRM|nr:lectin like domain-containing protein [Lientehia hominis]MCD2493307.1 lectin like domain-containing protein [Lientehia hominis]
MKMKELMKRAAAFGLAAALVVSGPVMSVSAAPGEGTGGKALVGPAELLEVDQSNASGGITPTVFHGSYRSAESGQIRGRSALPVSYNLSALGKSTTVKNQNPWGSCWAFGALSSLESSRLNGNSGSSEAPSPDYSERQLAWFAYETQTADSVKVSAADSDQAGEGITYSESGRLDKGGNMPQAVSLLATWQGAAKEDDAPYQNEAGDTSKTGIWSVAADKRNLSAVHLQNADFLGSPAVFDKYDDTGLPAADAAYIYNSAATADIKTALMNSGAVAIAYYADQSAPGGDKNGDYFNYSNYCQYVDVLNASTVQNHGVSIVGWDDDYASTNFKAGKQPEGNGAWLVKNSWGSGWGLDGYFWLSYYDRTIDQVTSCHGEGTDNYDNNYQYDYLGLASAMQFQPHDQEMGIANVFTAKGDEEIQAVSAVTLVPGSVVSIKIYKVPAGMEGPVPSGTQPIAEKTEMITYSGYHTIKLDAPAAIGAGEKFSVVEVIKGSDGKWYTPVEIGADSLNQTAVCNEGESFLVSGSEFIDMTEQAQTGITFGNVMIKAFTNDAALESAAPDLLTFDCQAFDKTDLSIKADTITVNGTGMIIDLPAGTSYIKITNPALSDGADVTAQMSVKVNGSDYTLGDRIARADLIKENGGTSVVMTTKSAPAGSNTKEYEFSYTVAPLELKADNDRVTVTDNNGYLPANAALSAARIGSGAVYDAVRTALEPMGGAENFYLYALEISPELKDGESVDLGIFMDDGYPRSDKTVLYYFDESTGSLSETANDSAGTGVLRADVGRMGYYVVSQVKEKPPVPELEAIIYSPVKTLADVTLPNVDGGTWNWDDSGIVPDVKTRAYKATFTADAGSLYYTYKADISLTVNKADPVQSGRGSGSQIIYGQSLGDSLIKETFELDGMAVNGTIQWKQSSLRPEVKDSNATEYDIIFTPGMAESENYNTAEGSLKVTEVLKKQVTVNIKDTAKVYGDKNPAFSLEIPDGALVGDDTAADLAVEFDCPADRFTPAGSSVAVTGTSSSANYNVSVVNGWLTVKKRAVDIKAKDVTLKYGEGFPAPYEIEVYNLPEGVEQSALGVTADVEPLDMSNGNLAGTYTLKVKTAAIADGNYEKGRLLNGILTIEEGTVKKVENSSGIPDSDAINFEASGNLKGTEILKILDLTDEAVRKAFQDKLENGQLLGSVFDITLVNEDRTETEIKGALTVTIPVSMEYNGKQIAVFHYVKEGKRNNEDIVSDKDTIDTYKNLTVVDGKVQVKVYSLSPFALAFPRDADASEENTRPSGTTEIPSADNHKKPEPANRTVNNVKTGDSAPVTALIISAIAAAVILLILAVVMVRKRKKR